jgi:predicted TIM-barrel fold metal-dependent hydrolase
MIIDSHCHAGAGDGFTGPWDTRAPLGAYLRRAREAGIDRTVIFAAFTSDYALANREVADIVRRHPDRFLGFVFVHAARDRGKIGRLVEEGTRAHGFCGIKLHRSDARITREVCEVAQAFSLPVLYDVVGDVSSVQLFAREYPAVAFIVPHLGSFADDWAAQTAFVDHLAHHPNVHTDTSGVRRFDLLLEAIRRAGARKVLFGSDGPWLHPGVELAKIRALKLPNDEERLVLGENFLRLTARARHRHSSRFASSSWSARSVTLSSFEAS